MAPHSLRTDVSSSTKASSLKTPSFPLKINGQISLLSVAVITISGSSAIKLTVQRGHVVHLFLGCTQAKRMGVLRGGFEKSPLEIPTMIMFCRHGSNFSSPIIVGTLKASRIKMFLIAYTALNHLQVFDEHDWQQLPDLCSTLHVTVLKRVSTFSFHQLMFQ